MDVQWREQSKHQQVLECDWASVAAFEWEYHIIPMNVRNIQICFFWDAHGVW